MAEYNPLHKGHKKQFNAIRQAFGADCCIVCAMSGNFVQRGEPAVFPAALRAEAAVRCGADLVIELPVTAALSSAEGFALGGVRWLSRLCQVLCFGAETPDAELLLRTAEGLLSPAFSERLREALAKGCSFPAARQTALERLGLSFPGLQGPNNILAVEYCKAILTLGSQLTPYPIFRPGDYHAAQADAENPSATALRRLLLAGQDTAPYLPVQAAAVFSGAVPHCAAYGEAAMLYRLRTMTDGDFEALPYGSEGLWRRLMHECRRQPTVDAILEAVKTKRYTHTRLTRMLLCAFLGLTEADFRQEAPYARILAFSQRGRQVLRETDAPLRNLGAPGEGAYGDIEQRLGSLYGLFAPTPEPPVGSRKSRVFFLRETDVQNDSQP